MIIDKSARKVEKYYSMEVILIPAQCLFSGL